MEEKTLLRKLRNAVRDPRRTANFVAAWAPYMVRRMMVRRVQGQGGLFYEYRGERYPEYLRGGNAMSHILDKARVYCRGHGLDIGASQWPFPGAIPVQDDPEQNAYKLDDFPDHSLDYVFSSHCIEHLDRWQEALKLWIGKIKPGGVLFLYLPHHTMWLWRPGGAWVGLDHKWSPSYEVVGAFLEGQGMKILDLDRGRDKYWSFYVVAERVVGR